MFLVKSVREDAHKQSVFFSGRTTKRGEGVKSPLSLSKHFFIKGKDLRKKYEPLRSRGRRVPRPKKTTFYASLP